MEQSICIFGASSTQGFYDSERGGWADRLKTYLYEKTVKEDNCYFEVFNLGISGNTSRELLERIDSECKSRHPSLVIVSLGDNDSALGVSLGEFESNMNKVITLAKRYAKNILLLGCKKVDEKRTIPVEWDKTLKYYNEKIVEYDKKLEEMAKNNHICYLKLIDLLNDGDLEDGLHPNAKGHNKIFVSVRDFLINLKWI